MTPDQKLLSEVPRGELGEALAGVANRDVIAFRQLYDLTSAKLFGICLRICGNRASAEDVMQDVLSKIWTHAATYDPARSSPITWLCAIARNSSIDWLRANERHAMVSSMSPHGAADHEGGAEQQLLDRQEHDRLRLCLDQLEDRQRFCIRAAFFDGFTYSDLAEQIDAPLNTVKTWMRRGMQRLKACLSDG